MWGNKCGWSQARLPLLAGGELIGPDRRQLERHLIECPPCRERLVSMQSALGALRGAGEHAPIAPESPSLWPSLELEIRESRRALPGSSLPSFVRASLAACVVTAVAAGALVVSRRGPARPEAPVNSPVAVVAPDATAPAKPTKIVSQGSKLNVASQGGRPASKGKPKAKAPAVDTSPSSRPSEEPDRGNGASSDTRYTQ
jgi:anti-sigma factor RsiW